jgi:endonuclease-3
MQSRKARITAVLDYLGSVMDATETELDYTTPFELLIAVMLSAQCTDKRVNEVTKTLFQVANTPDQFAQMQQETLEKLIFSCGFYRNKAKNIISASKAIVENYNGQVPEDFSLLLTLPGVGRKTANVMSAEAFNKQAIAVDTHVFRTANRLGLAKGKTPFEVEKQLREVLPSDKYTRMHHLLIFHGRYTCKSQNPDCNNCALHSYCIYENKKIKTKEV